MEKESFPCDICAETFAVKSDLMYHMKFHTKEKTTSESRGNSSKSGPEPVEQTKESKKEMIQRVIDKEFSSSINTNYFKYIGNFNIGCSFLECHCCEKVFKERSDLEEHKKLHSAIELLCCRKRLGKIEVKGYDIGLKPVDHSKQKKTDEEETKSLTDVFVVENCEHLYLRNALYFCGYCKEEIKGNSDFDRHEKDHSMQKPIQFSFDSTLTIVLDYGSIHFGGKPDDDDANATKVRNVSIFGKIMQCTGDDYWFFDYANFPIGEVDLVCAFCAKELRTKSDFEEHLMAHSKMEPTLVEYRDSEGKLMCKIMGHGKLSSENIETANEERSEGNVKKMAEAEKSDEQFVAKDPIEPILKQIHIGNDLFVCGNCSKEFKKHSDLYEHMKMHFKEKSAPHGKGTSEDDL